MDLSVVESPRPAALLCGEASVVDAAVADIPTGLDVDRGFADE